VSARERAKPWFCEPGERMHNAMGEIARLTVSRKEVADLFVRRAPWSPLFGFGAKRVPRKLKKRLRRYEWRAVYGGNLNYSAPNWNGKAVFE
jgi:hypothetical protein